MGYIKTYFRKQIILSFLAFLITLFKAHEGMEKHELFTSGWGGEWRVIKIGYPESKMIGDGKVGGQKVPKYRISFMDSPYVFSANFELDAVVVYQYFTVLRYHIPSKIP